MSENTEDWLSYPVNNLTIFQTLLYYLGNYFWVGVHQKRTSVTFINHKRKTV